MSTNIEKLPGFVTALQKGGVTKTSLGLNVAERLSARGNDVVVIDLDHDCHLTSLLLDDQTEEKVLNNYDKHIGKAMFGDTDPEDLLLETDFGLHLLPSTNAMEEVKDRMKNTTFGVNKLRNEVVTPLNEAGYDYFVIDPPGGEGQMLHAAFAAVQRTIIPITPEAGTVNGLARLINRTIEPLRDEFPIEVVAITPNRMQETISRESSEQQIIRQLNNEFRDLLPEYAKVDPEVFEKIDDPGTRLTDIPKPGIRERKAINDAFKNGLPVAHFDSGCDQIENFDLLAQLVIESCGGPKEESEEEVTVHG